MGIYLPKFLSSRLTMGRLFENAHFTKLYQPMSLP